MGVGATPADVATMVNNTSDKCAFACHDLSAVPNDYYTKAKLLGVTMRIDVVRSATQQLMDTATATAVSASQFRVAIYDFGTSASLGLTNIAPLTTSLTVAKTQAAAGGRCQAPIDVSYCTAVKNRGIKIAVLYTTYLPLPTNPWYNSWIAPFTNQIGTNMQSCASPDLYFEVSPTQGISDAMNALFKKVVAQAHLTQ